MLSRWQFLFCLFVVLGFRVLEGLTQIAVLDSHHQVQNEEGTKNHGKMEEGIVGVSASGMSDFIHFRGPSFEGDHDEHIQDTLQNIVETGHAIVWIPPDHTDTLLACESFGAVNVVIVLVFKFLVGRLPVFLLAHRCGVNTPA